MNSSWDIQFWPDRTYDLFMSHVAENRENLVWPVYQQLKADMFVPWIDQQDYPLGFESIEALRTRLLFCSHIVYFITPEMLRQGRGWTAAERTLSGIIQAHFHFGAQVFHQYQLPLFFIATNDYRSRKILQRSVWAPLMERGIFCPHSLKESTQSASDWACGQIKRFINDEQLATISGHETLSKHPQAQEFFLRYEGLLRWIQSLGPYDLSP